MTNSLRANHDPDRFEANGHVVLESLLDEPELARLEAALPTAGLRAGTRNLLHAPWCTSLAIRLKRDEQLAPLLPTDPVAVQCTYFVKSETDNWLVALHRDLSIPVRHHVASPAWRGWSEKEGERFAQPPLAVLASIVAVRLHLEDNTDTNGPLQVVPGSHRHLGTDGERVSCLVRRGGAVVMRPLLLHASKKVLSGRRRVLHILFAGRSLPDGAEWAHAV
ncbi:MAG: phytanoyl-CoA dioxygenase family protein [Planctomycetota bacterium]